MEQTESSEQETTTVCINRDETCKTEEYGQSNMTRVKETNGFQICTYLITIYFLAVTLFYLFACLLKSRYVECQLQCSEPELICKCNLESRVSWSTPTFVQLSWSQSRTIRDQLEEITLYEALIQEKENQIKFQSELYAEVNCFPSECLVLVGTVSQIIADNSKFILKFSNKMPICNNQNPKLLFREVNPNYPQLSTYSQLGINLFFAIVVGVFVFFRQKMQIEMVQPINIKNKKLIEPLQNQKSGIEFPEDIIALNNELQKNRSKAARHILNKIGKNVLNYSFQDQFSREFTQTL